MCKIAGSINTAGYQSDREQQGSSCPFAAMSLMTMIIAPLSAIVDITCSICFTRNFTGIKTIKNDRELGFFHFMVLAAVYYRSHRTHLIVAPSSHA